MNHTHDLVDVAQLLPELVIDLKYASADNITGHPIYRDARCLLHPRAAQGLARSAEIARLARLRLLIYDAWRPREAQRILWQFCPDPHYVVPDSQGSNHSRGTAIDLTLLDEHGTLLDMGAGFDDMQPRSHPFHPAVAPGAQRNRLLLNALMYAGGFTGIATEWWHFELPDAATYPLADGGFGCWPAPTM